MTEPVRKRVPWACLALFGAAAALGCAASPAGEAPDATAPLPEIGTGGAGVPDFVLWLSVSGLETRHYLGAAPPMRMVAALARGGVAAEAVVPVTPASVYPIHATWVTGLSADVHGVPADRGLDERGVTRAKLRDAEAFRARPLWWYVANAGRTVAALDWPTTFGANVGLLIPDAAAVGPEEAWHLVTASASAPALAGLVRAAPDAAERGPERDNLVAATTCRLLGARTPPPLVLARLSQAEPVLLRDGPESEAAKEAFRNLDTVIANVLACLGPRLEQTAVVLTGDGVYEPVHTRLRPNALLRQVGMIQADSWRAIARSHGGAAFVHARTAEDAVRARRILTETAERSGAFRIVGAEEMIALHADPESWFGLAAAPGFAFDDSPEGQFESPATARGAAGYLPTPGSRSLGVVLWGRGVRSGVRVPRVAAVDVGPTVATLLGVSLDPISGAARKQWLRMERTRESE